MSALLEDGTYKQPGVCLTIQCWADPVDSENLESTFSWLISQVSRHVSGQEPDVEKQKGADHLLFLKKYEFVNKT